MVSFLFRSNYICIAIISLKKRHPLGPPPRERRGLRASEPLSLNLLSFWEAELWLAWAGPAPGCGRGLVKAGPGVWAPRGRFL